MEQPHVYPARLSAALDEPLSRWRWLVKWFLAIPHVVVLVFLWVAVAVLTIAAGIAILFSGRYPRRMFDFNVAVMQWTWRVSFYAFSGIGTDRYPPFGLHPVTDFPATFEVDYPERLSRGLVLVKWWLLALPQLLIVALLIGGLPFARVGGGVVGLLTIAAGIVLLVQGRYPRALFDVIIGMDRWCYRVLAYVLLLRDEYPPFRFDGGGADPGDRPEPPEESYPEEWWAA